MSGPLLLHVGYHKTGTTWLQRVLFTGRFGWAPLMSHEEVFATITRPHALAFDPAPAQALIAARAGPGAANVISSEILSGHPFYGARESAEFARRLAAVAPGARILITIREQMRIMTSVYMQYLSRAGTLAPEAFFRDDPVVGFTGFDPVHYEYHRLAGLYQQLFGAASVLVATQEALARDPAGFAARIAAFAGNPVRPAAAELAGGREAVSYPEYAAPLLRRANFLRAGPAGLPVADLGAAGRGLYRLAGGLARLRPVAALMGGRRPVLAHVQARFAGRFAASNRALAAMLADPPDLAGYDGM
jgi:hypothetical protein